MTKPSPLPFKLGSRAVGRLITPGTYAICPTCQESIGFEAKKRLTQVICNVYVDDKWARVEQYHSGCYEQAGSPYGPPLH